MFVFRVSCYLVLSSLFFEETSCFVGSILDQHKYNHTYIYIYILSFRFRETGFRPQTHGFLYRMDANAVRLFGSFRSIAFIACMR